MLVVIVVSASSDRTIKLWKPYSETPRAAHTIGYHTDYAKCLTYASKPGWVASGGLDRRINIWDIEKSEASLTIDAGPASHFTDGSSDSTSMYSRPHVSFQLLSIFLRHASQHIEQMFNLRLGCQSHRQHFSFGFTRESSEIVGS